MGKKKEIFRALGVAGLAALAGLSLTGCSNAVKEADTRLSNDIVNVLNMNAEEQNLAPDTFAEFQFLCADVENSSGNYNVDINGISTLSNSNKAYTTVNYVVDGKYFNNINESSKEEVLNALATVVENENFQSISVQKVNDVKALNSSVGKAIDCPLKEFKLNSNFLYSANNVTVSEDENIASFATKEGTTYSKTTSQLTWGIVGTVKGKIKYGWVVTSKTDYETFYSAYNIYLKLTPEEVEMAKNDNSYVFDRFVSMVKNSEKDKYVVQQTSIQKGKDYGASMFGSKSLS